MRSTNIDIQPSCSTRRSGYTLVEMLLSVVLTLMLMYGVAQIFSIVGDSVNDSRALLGIGDRLRATGARLQLDLDGVTSNLTPPAKPEDNGGYFEIIEGPVGPVVPLISTPTITSRARNITASGSVEDDTTAIDYDDILMFTTRTTTNDPFIGKAVTMAGVGTVESRFAEVAWFVRGRTLYRRVKIVKPDFHFNPATPNQELGCQYLFGSNLSANLTDIANGALGSAGIGLIDTTTESRAKASFENLFDLSVHFECNQADPTDLTFWKWVPNSLTDLTKRENRFCHAPVNISGSLSFTDRFPFAVHNTDSWRVLGLPTTGETSSLEWMVYQWEKCYYTGGGPELPRMNTATPLALVDRDTTDALDASSFEMDFWNEPYPYQEQDPITGNLIDYEGPRLGEDVIMTNVIGFDVKVWDPDAPVLSYNGQILQPGDPGYPHDPSNPLDFNSLPTAVWSVVSYGAFVDLGYGSGFTNLPATKLFAFGPNTKSGFVTDYVYDTWSTHYENDGVDQIGVGLYDLGYNGLDDDLDGAGTVHPNGLVDDAAELDTSPPYPVPLEAIQIKIRVFEPDSRQVREVTIVHRFPKK